MFKVPESEANKPENRFEFEIAGKAYSMPKLSYAPVEASILFAQGYNVEGLVACADDQDTRVALNLLTGDQLKALEKALIEASRVAPGESDSSDDS